MEGVVQMSEKLVLSIEYCNSWGYRPKAAGLADAIKKKFPVSDISLIPSSGGVFEVRANDRVVFSKKSLGRFPEEGEVENALSLLK